MSSLQTLSSKPRQATDQEHGGSGDVSSILSEEKSLRERFADGRYYKVYRRDYWVQAFKSFGVMRA